MMPVLTEKFEGVGTSIRAEGFGVGGGEKGLVVGCNFFWIPMQLGLDVGGWGDRCAGLGVAKCDNPSAIPGLFWRTVSPAKLDYVEHTGKERLSS